MHTAEKQYETIKCERCGHERQGRRIIRLPATDYAEWKNIVDRKNRVGLHVTLLVSGAVCATVVAIKIPPLLLSSNTLQILTGMALGLPIIALATLSWQWLWRRQDRKYARKNEVFWASRTDILDGEDPERVSILPIEE